MGINESFCNCKCDLPKDEPNFNMDEKKNPINEEEKDNKLNVIDLQSFIKKNSNTQNNYNAFAKQNLIIQSLNNNNSNIYKSISYSYIQTNSGAKNKKVKPTTPKDIKIVLLQSAYRGIKYRKIFPKIKQSLQSLENKKIECFKIRFDHENPTNTEEIKGKFNPQGWKSYYPPTKASFFEYNQEKNGKIYPCKLLTYKDVSYYIGTVNINYQRSGQGILVDISGSRSEGMWVADKLNGWCRVVDGEGTLSEGLYINNLLKGKGERFYADGTIYKGDFNDGVRHGEGIEETNEHVFSGTFVNGKKQGNGKLKYKSKEDVYIGEFKNNTITGVGKYIWKNKDVYEGTFLCGKMHGKGKYKWADGDEYEGEYVDGLKEGVGVFKWSNGKIYSGTFSNGKPNGKGIFYSDNKKYDVIFVDGRMTETNQIAN